VLEYIKNPFYECILNLREQCFGIFEGKSSGLDKEYAMSNNIPIRSFKPDKGESLLEVNKRASEFLDNLIENFYFISNKQNGNGSILINKNELEKENFSETFKILAITHSNFLSEFLNVIFERRNEEIKIKNLVINTSVYALKIYCKNCVGKQYCCCGKDKSDLVYDFELFNDSTHLDKQINLDDAENLGD